MRIDQNLFYNVTVLLLHQNDDISISIANDFIRLYKNNNNTLTDKDKELIGLYITMIKEIISSGLAITKGITDVEKQKNLETKALLNKFMTSPVALKYPSILNGMSDLIENRLGENTLTAIRKEIKNSLIYRRSVDNVKKMSQYLNNFDNSIDLGHKNDQIELFKASVNDLMTVVESSHLNTSEDLNSVESISLTNIEETKNAIASHNEVITGKVLKTGCSGLINTRNPHVGFHLGQLVVFSAITSHYKSSMLLNIVRWLTLFNNWNEFGKNCLLPFISLENKVSYNFTMFAKFLYYDLNKDDPDVMKQIRLLDPDKISLFVKNALDDRNIAIRFERHTPFNFSHYSFEAIINNFIKAGYDVPTSVLDYLTLMSRDGLSGTLQEQVQKQFNYMCNFGRDLDHTIFSGHQLNNVATERASLISNPVMSFDEKCLAMSMDVAREIDILYFMHIVTIANKKFITIRKHKDRYNADTAETDKWFAYQLKPLIGIENDIGNPAYISTFTKLNEIATDIASQGTALVF